MVSKYACGINHQIPPNFYNSGILIYPRTVNVRWSHEGVDILKSFISLTLLTLISQNVQTHLNNSLANCRRIVGVCLTILWDWRLKGHNINTFYVVNILTILCRLNKIK